MNESVINKIQNLLNLTTEKGCTDAEAQSALMKAQELMAKYNIKNGDLTTEAYDDTDVIIITCEHKGNLGYRKDLASVIATNYRCKGFIEKKGKGDQGTVRFIGVRNDALIAKSAFEFAYQYIKKQGRKEYQKWMMLNVGYSGMGVFNSYAMGFILGLNEVLSTQAKALMIIMPQTVNDVHDSMKMTKSRGGITQSYGYYKDVLEKGKQDARDQFGISKLTSDDNQPD